MTTSQASATTIAPSANLANLKYAIRDLAVLAAEVQKSGPVLYLNVGDPLKFDFATPPHLIEAVIKAMRDGQNGYAASEGLPSAVEAVRREAERKGITTVQNVFITQGVGETVDVCLTALLNRGENILTPSPDYPLYSACLTKLGIELNAYELNEDNGWQPDLADIERKITPKTRGIVLINPNNPTGAIYSRQTLDAIAELARKHNLVVFADEIYDKLLLDTDGTGDEMIAFASLAPDVPCITFGGMSKNYLAPGWRLGWGIASGDAAAMGSYVESIFKILRARLSANLPMQHAIAPALDGPQDHLMEVNRKLKSRRDLTAAWCDATPRVSLIPPKAAFYAFAKIDIPEDDETFVKALLQEKHVLVVHGSGFGQRKGTQHFRIVFLPEEAVLSQAYASIASFLAARYK